jgi:hypothetical protein
MTFYRDLLLSTPQYRCDYEDENREHPRCQKQAHKSAQNRETLPAARPKHIPDHAERKCQEEQKAEVEARDTSSPASVLQYPENDEERQDIHEARRRHLSRRRMRNNVGRKKEADSKRKEKQGYPRAERSRHSSIPSPESLVLQSTCAHHGTALSACQREIRSAFHLSLVKPPGPRRPELIAQSLFKQL